MVGFVVVVLGPKAFATGDAFDPIELGGLAELEGQEDLDRRVAGPAPHVTDVLAIEEDPGEKGIRGDLLGDLGCDRPDPGDLTELALSDVGPTPLGHLMT